MKKGEREKEVMEGGKEEGRSGGRWTAHIS